MKYFRLIFSLISMVACAAIGFLMGFDTLAFQMGAAMSVAHFLVAVLPRGTTGLQYAMCDDDLVGQMQELTKSMKDTRADLAKQQTELKDAHTKVMDSLEKGAKLDPETQGNIDKAIAKANETGTLVGELSQKIEDLSKAAKDGPAGPATIGSEIMKSLEGDSKERYQSILKGDSRNLRIVLKEITSASVGTGMKREPYIDSLVNMERQPLRIRDLLTVIPVQSDAVKYGKQTLRTNAARIVAEGTKKPYSDYKWEDATATIETVAHLAKLTLQALADAPRLAAEVASELRYGLALAEEAEILNGDGTAGHLSGLMDNATAYAVPAGMDASNVLTPIDRLRVAILQVHLAFAIPDGHVLNPINVAEIDLLRRDADKNGGYLFSRPDGDTGVARMWRLPVVESPSMLVNEFLTGAFKYSTHLYDRQGVTVAISTENEDDFETNKATMRCESRIGLGVRRPYGLVAGSLKAGS